MELLLKLMDRPDMSSNEYSATLRQWMWLIMGDANRMVSSVNWRLDMTGFELGSLMP